MNYTKTILVGFLCCARFAFSQVTDEVKTGNHQLKGRNLSAYLGPNYTHEHVKNNHKLFAQYCLGDNKAEIIPIPNYSNELVINAAKKLSRVKETNLVNYTEIIKIYRSGAGTAPVGISNQAHIYLVQLCGEYRDRSTMIEAKLKWINNIVMLKDIDQPLQIDKEKNIWSQLSGREYNSYLKLSSEVFTQRELKTKEISFGNNQDSLEAVEAFTVCETQYMIEKYIAPKLQFESLETYESGLQEYAKTCRKQDLEYYYDFRGDSNFKMYSPESNAMIWHARSIARWCETPVKAKAGSHVVTDKLCEQYFSQPFLHRYNAARAALAGWLLYDAADEQSIANPQNTINVLSNLLISDVAPFKLHSPTSSFKNSKGFLNSADLGFNQELKLGTNRTTESDLENVYLRLRNAVNRHTNWYASGYNDGTNDPKGKMSQAYSPFVASSYEMSKSNGFAQCGTTVSCKGDGRKAWMFVFKVHKRNWYRPERLKNKEAINFDKYWFDERGFGTDRLARAERAWDRLGTPMEYELDTIMYLHNLDSTSGKVVGADTLD